MQYTTEEEVLKLGEIDPELAAVSSSKIISTSAFNSRSLQLLGKLRMPALDYSNIDQFKNMTENRTAARIDALCAPPPDIKQTDYQVPIYDGSTVRARVYQPVPLPKAGSPLIVM
jgi:hypothetical protein